MTHGFARLVVLILQITSGLALAQNLPTATLSGRVVDAANDAPLLAVNVFLANTLLGGQTDTSGVFEIRNVPLGTHELIVSLLGYELQQRILRVTTERVSGLNFKLVARALQGPEVEVVAEAPQEWRKNLRKFEEFFWGNSPFASQCTILNSQILDFTIDAGHWFTATASAPLAVENHGLGYRLNIILKKFEYNERRREIHYSLIPHFEELQARDEEEAKLWRENRVKAYRGSLRHFLAALSQGRSYREGFQIYTVMGIPWEASAAKYVLTKPERLLSPASQPFERMLSFQNFLEITFNREREKTSWIRTTTDSVLINTSGYVNNGFDVFIYGYWFYQRIAEALPREYKPVPE